MKFGVLSLCDWTVAAADEEANWVSFSTKQGQASSEATQVIVTFGQNPTNAERTAKLRFTPAKQEFGSVTVTVIQEASQVTLTVSPSYVDANPSGGNMTFNINSLSQWSIRSTEEWIQFEQSEGDAGTHSVTASISPNPSPQPRGAVIFIENGTRTIEIPVEQSAFDMLFHVSPTKSEVVMVDGTTLTYRVGGDFEWEVIVPDWMGAERGEPSQDGTIPVSVNVSANDMNMERTGFTEFIPVPTYRGGVTLDPAAWGYHSVFVGIPQEGGRAPAGVLLIAVFPA